jgi:uncharacterized protein
LPLDAADMNDYRAPHWLPGGNLQTIWSARVAERYAGPPPQFRRERWDTPDGDFMDVDFLDTVDAGAPMLVLFHGLEGSSSSHYAQAFGHAAAQRGMAYAVPHFRGCSGELNRAPRAYHSGDYEEIAWVLQRLRLRAKQPLRVVGISLGGNALLRWAQEAEHSAAQLSRAVAAISSPVDLAASGHAIGRGFNRQVYTRMFLATMKPKALRKLAQFPGLFDGRRLLAARDLYEFDNVFTAPLHGFRNTDDYWRRASAKPHLGQIRIPALVLNALNDPFVPAASLPRPQEVRAPVTLWQPAHGGHVGFVTGAPRGHLRHLPQQVLDWMQRAGGALATCG